ncbi:hypothetical protein BDZ85DRAFT_70481 [Elsinoe ampelina]|uniref:Uncharacterized protein n=1 Tax=Elsinoe ampelina TaxID=302913 RepID=A0A6A6GJC7_9PEZI|nr:hypothetical protein BDZ85DRAFT_70481 [Elsinoe ampelina]
MGQEGRVVDKETCCLSQLLYREGRGVSPRAPPFGFPRACACAATARRAARPALSFPTSAACPVSAIHNFYSGTPSFLYQLFSNPSHTPHLPIPPSIACQRISAPIRLHT